MNRLFDQINQADNPNKRILLIQLGDIGDVILTFPAVQAIRNHFPDAGLVFCVREKAGEIAADLPWVNEVMTVQKTGRSVADETGYQIDWFRRLRRHRFDLAIDLRTGARGAIIAGLSGARYRIGRFAEDGGLWRNRVFHTLVNPENEVNEYAVQHNLNILAPLDLSPMPTQLFFPVPEYRKQRAHRLLLDSGIAPNRPVMAFHPFSLWSYKEWNPVACARLIDHIHSQTSFQVIITGAPDERHRADQLVQNCVTRPVNLAGLTGIGDLAGVLKHCRLFVGVDTAALHISAAVGTPTIGIFGPSSPISWAPRGDQHRVIQKSLSCVPCRQKGCYNREISRCLQDLSFEEVRPILDNCLQSIPAN